MNASDTLLLGPWRALLLAAAVLSLASGCATNRDAQTPVGVSYGPDAASGAAPVKNDDGSYSFAGLRYLEFETGGAGANDSLPLVVLLHGHGQSPKTFERFADFPARARFVAPFGPTQIGEHSYEWMTGGISTPSQHAELTRALPPVAARVSAWIAEIARVRPTVGKPVVAGFSQGATLTYGLALLHADQLSVACPMAGQVPEDLFAGASVPPQKCEVHGVHGDADAKVAIADAQRTVALLQQAGFVADLKVEPGVGHQMGPGMPDVMACINRGITLASAPPR